MAFQSLLRFMGIAGFKREKYFGGKFISVSTLSHPVACSGADTATMKSGNAASGIATPASALSDSESELSDSASALSNSASALSDSASTLSISKRELSDSASALSNPASALSDSASTLSISKSALSDSASTLSISKRELSDSASALSDPACKLSNLASKLSGLTGLPEPSDYSVANNLVINQLPMCREVLPDACRLQNSYKGWFQKLKIQWLTQRRKGRKELKINRFFFAFLAPLRETTQFLEPPISYCLTIKTIQHAKVF